MSSKIKGILGAIILFAAAIPIMHPSAAAVQVGTMDELNAAIANGGEIELTADITVTEPILVTKNVTIDGKGHALNSTVPEGSGNKTIISAMTSTTLTLKDITLADSPKYGVQAYNGGKVVLDKVTIKNCKFGAALINGGTLTVKDLTMDGNKAGVEFGKGINVTGEPALVMDGIINAANQENALYIDNDQVEKFVVKNTDTTTNKVSLDGDVVVVKDADGKQVAASNTITEGSKVEIDGNEEIAAPTSEVKPEVKPEPKPEVKNPEIADGILMYIALAIVAIGGVAVSSRKLAKQN